MQPISEEVSVVASSSSSAVSTSSACCASPQINVVERGGRSSSPQRRAISSVGDFPRGRDSISSSSSRVCERKNRFL
ncbi:hypothetical protein PBY51_018559 [Eleginops maclovinus]|uniref:Uncharacterized protein n=1 Tax=Eleginops maclovinus TaxID=56733 RepID=A0AAN8AXH7_ELEMC|nr:hypothetical protein PBY51_018559 [Eleginops maclovinus]